MSAVAKRLAQLGAMTKGDRHSGAVAEALDGEWLWDGVPGDVES